MFDGSLGELHETRSGVLHIEWKIDAFLSVASTKEFHLSPPFSFLKSCWCLKTYPFGEEGDDDARDSIPLYLDRRKSFSTEVVTFNFGIKKADGSLCSRIQLIWKYTSNEGYGHPEIVKRSELLKRKSELLPSDALILTCDLKKASPSQEMNTLCAALTNMLDSKMDCDVTINVGQQAFEAHKLILSAWSSVFAAMFKHEMSEKNSGVVNIEDCDPNAFKDFLRFLYTGQVAVNGSNVFHLYRTAHKYCVEELKTYCVAFMMDNLSIDSVCSVVALADCYSENDLYNLCVAFFEDNILSVLFTPSWESFLKENYLAANKLLKDTVPKIVIKNRMDI